MTGAYPVPSGDGSARKEGARRNVTEVCGHGSGRLGLAVLPDASGPTLRNFAKATTEPGAIVHTDGLQSYRVLARHGHSPSPTQAGESRVAFTTGVATRLARIVGSPRASADA